jgi:hypothetical protein
MIATLERFPVLFQFPNSSPLRFFDVIFPLFLNMPALDFRNNFQHSPSSLRAVVDVVYVGLRQDARGRTCGYQRSVVGGSTINDSR